ncbi:MAG: hypothetical protein II839_05205, partial [Kiritimatiellae bacterium]|nr:hypothetical protein [Kiritimatiellia bacterium]
MKHTVLPALALLGSAALLAQSCTEEKKPAVEPVEVIEAVAAAPAAEPAPETPAPEAPAPEAPAEAPAAEP